jgi:hypothetical protein
MVRSWWLTPIILATQEAEIRIITVQSQPEQILHVTLSQNKQTKRTCGVAQGVGPEFKPQYHKKTKNPKKQKTQKNGLTRGELPVKQYYP